MTPFTVASFNLHWGGLTTDGVHYDAAEIVRGLAADVIVLQEAWWPDEGTGVLDELAADGFELHEQPLRLNVPRKKDRTEPRPLGHWGIAVLSRFPILRTRALPMGDVPGDPTRGRAAVLLQLAVEGSPLDLVAVHTSAVVMVGPTLQLRRLAPQLPAHHPTVVAGDLNTTWRNIRPLLGRRWRRAVTGPTWPSPRVMTQLDHILVNRGVDVIAGEVLEHAGSDHRPVRADLTFAVE